MQNSIHYPLPCSYNIHARAGRQLRSLLCLQPVCVCFCCPLGLNCPSSLSPSAHTLLVPLLILHPVFLCHLDTKMQLTAALSKSRIYFVEPTLILNTRYVLIELYFVQLILFFENTLCTYWVILCTADIVLEYIVCSNQVLPCALLDMTY